MNEPIKYTTIKEWEFSVISARIDYSDNDKEADSMFVHHACQQAMNEANEVIRKYAKIIPLRLRGVFEALVADARFKSLEDHNFTTKTDIPVLDGDEEYAKVAKLLAAGCYVNREILKDA